MPWVQQHIGELPLSSVMCISLLSLCVGGFIPDRGHQSQTAAAVPWKPGWGRWHAVVALQSQRPHPALPAVCALGRPDRWLLSGKYLPGNAPELDHHSVSPSLEEKTWDRISVIIPLLFFWHQGERFLLLVTMLEKLQPKS